VGPLSLVTTVEELFERKRGGSGERKKIENIKEGR
jgi:hypothetical protein